MIEPSTPVSSLTQCDLTSHVQSQYRPHLEAPDSGASSHFPISLGPFWGHATLVALVEDGSGVAPTRPDDWADVPDGPLGARLQGGLSWQSAVWSRHLAGFYR